MGSVLLSAYDIESCMERLCERLSIVAKHLLNDHVTDCCNQSTKLLRSCHLPRCVFTCYSSLAVFFVHLLLISECRARKLLALILQFHRRANQFTAKAH